MAIVRFIGDMACGILAQKGVKLSSVVRALKEDISPKKVEDRLSRMLSAKGPEASLHDAIAAEGEGSCAENSPGNAECSTGKLSHSTITDRKNA